MIDGRDISHGARVTGPTLEVSTPSVELGHDIANQTRSRDYSFSTEPISSWQHEEIESNIDTFMYNPALYPNAMYEATIGRGSEEFRVTDNVAYHYSEGDLQGIETQTSVHERMAEDL